MAEPVRPVRVVTVEKREAGETVSLTGQVQAQEEVNLSFRVSGRMIERSVNVGDRVDAGSGDRPVGPRTGAQCPADGTRGTWLPPWVR